MNDIFKQKPNKWEREARAGVQLNIQARIHYFNKIEAKEVEVLVSISNISGGGIGLVSQKEAVPLGTEIRATIQLPNTEVATPINVVGRVRRTKILGGDKYLIGVEFLNISKEDQDAIRRFISTQQMKEFF